VFDHPGHSTLGLRPLSGASVGWWEFEERRDPHGDWLGAPD
jgi:hypothetical protein